MRVNAIYRAYTAQFRVTRGTITLTRSSDKFTGIVQLLNYLLYIF